MSRQYEEREHRELRKVCSKVICDLCGAEGRVGMGEVAWLDAFNFERTTSPVMSTGWECPDGGEQVNTRFDICAKCFREKLMPWMAAQGASPDVEEIGF